MTALRVVGAGRRTIRAAKGGEGAVGTSRTRARILGLVVLLAPLAAAPAQAQGGLIMQELDRRQDQLIQEMRERQRRGDDRTDERRLIERREADRADERRRDALREIERREQIDADQRRERRPGGGAPRPDPRSDVRKPGARRRTPWSRLSRRATIESDRMTVPAMIRPHPALMLGLLLMAPVTAAADPLDWGPVVVPVPVAVGGPPPVTGWPVAPYTDVRTGRCLAGFARDVVGACVRHDEPRLICPPGGLAGEPCAVLAPSPQPYGPGAALRLNY